MANSVLEKSPCLDLRVCLFLLVNSGRSGGVQKCVETVGRGEHYVPLIQASLLPATPPGQLPFRTIRRNRFKFAFTGKAQLQRDSKSRGQGATAGT